MSDERKRDKPEDEKPEKPDEEDPAPQSGGTGDPPPPDKPK